MGVQALAQRRFVGRRCRHNRCNQAGGGGAVIHNDAAAQNAGLCGQGRFNFSRINAYAFQFQLPVVAAQQQQGPARALYGQVTAQECTLPTECG